MGCCLKKKSKNSNELSDKDMIGPLLKEDKEASKHSLKTKSSSTLGTLKIKKEDFTKLKVLGRGTFGKVLLVRNNNTGALYAMKILKKDQIKQQKQEIHTRTERQILEKMEHPFIVKLYYAFQDEVSLFLVTEFVQGGELFYHLRREQYFTLERAQFYAAELVLALEYIHKNNWIYRDLKPENVLLAKDGHIKLTDFGLSKIMRENQNSRAFTICGTPDYLAPEVLSDKGYDKTVDWWSLGVLLYEMLAGFSPFKLRRGDKITINNYKKELKMFSHFTEETKSILNELVVFDPEKRLGHGPEGTENVKKHPFFKNINWDDLLAKKVFPPFTPLIFSETDLSNFDHCFTEEEIDDKSDSEVDFAHSSKNNSKDEYSGFSYKNPNLDLNSKEGNEE